MAPLDALSGVAMICPIDKCALVEDGKNNLHCLKCKMVVLAIDGKRVLAGLMDFARRLQQLEEYVGLTVVPAEERPTDPAPAPEPEDIIA